MVRSPNSTTQNGERNSNKAPPLYKINRPIFLNINVQARELVLIQVLKGFLFML